LFNDAVKTQKISTVINVLLFHKIAHIYSTWTWWNGYNEHSFC